jgi:hypothetical protein
MVADKMRFRSKMVYQILSGKGNYLNQYDSVKKKSFHFGNKIFLAALPKSAGTYISKSLSGYSGYPYLHLSDIKGACEFDIYRPRCIDTYEKNIIVHQHTLATPGNVDYLIEYGFKVVIITRNIFDVIISFKEHLEIESTYWPFFSIPDNYLNYNDKEKYDFIIRFVLPWMVHFYVTWFRCVYMDRRIEAKWIYYSDYFKSEDESFKELLNYAGLPSLNQHRSIKYNDSLNEKHRYNVGKSYRGSRMLTEDHVSQIEHATRYYSDVDFKLFGIR